MESPPAILGHALPNELLGSEKAAHSEPVVMTTMDKEKYTCVLPQTSPSEDEEVVLRIASFGLSIGLCNTRSA